jgi:uncharacterized protein (AIM24 family)
MREFETATDLQPDHKKAHNYLGLALAQAGEYGRARQHFLQAGSEVMADKMARAIAGDRFAQPVRPSSPSLPVVPAARPASGGESQWGTQFGLDEGPSDGSPPSDAQDDEDMRFAEDEGPGALSGEASGDAQADSTPSERFTTRASSEPRPEMSLEEATPELPTKIAAFRPGSVVPVLAELTPAVVLAGASQDNPFRVGNGHFSAFVEGELLTRLEGLVAWSGALQFQPEPKRIRGRVSEQSFGQGPGQLVRASGQGVLFLEAPSARSFLAVELGDEGVYVREECLFAFEEAVAFENGKVPSDEAPDLDLVYLSGRGRVVLSLSGTLRSVAVAQEVPVTVPLSHLVGWQGKVSPRVVSLPAEEGQSPRVAVELSGEGFALIALPVR